MSINIGPPKVDELRPRITVIGVGGAGGNAIANMINAQIEGVDFVVANTDAQALNNSIAEHRIQLGPEITQGLGAGARPEVGRAAAEETLDDIERALEGSHMCFIAAGMGGGTGTGAAPVIAKTARDRGVLTVGVVTKPFLFEGTRRMRSADSGIEELQKHVDTLIVIPNQNLFLVAKAETTFKQAFELADEVLQQGVRSITDLMVMPGLINLDFADVRSVMGEMGKAMMGTGEGEGQNRALDAAERAISNPLLDGVSMQGAKGVIISIIGGEDMKLLEVDEAANHIRELVDPNANIIWGSAFNPELGGKIRVSVVATGIEQAHETVDDGARPFATAGNARGPVRPGGARPAASIAPAPRREAAAAARTPEPARNVVADPADAGGYPTSDGAGRFGAEDSDADEAARAADAEAADALDLELELDGAGATTNGSGAGRDERVPLPRGDTDELLLADRLADDEPDVPARIPRGDRWAAPTPRLGGGFGTANVTVTGPGYSVSSGGSGSGGTTLFERMANLSRNARPANAAAADPADNGEGPALSIPRFLGRQNNQ